MSIISWLVPLLIKENIVDWHGNLLLGRVLLLGELCCCLGRASLLGMVLCSLGQALLLGRALLASIVAQECFTTQEENCCLQLSFLVVQGKHDC